MKKIFSIISMGTLFLLLSALPVQAMTVSPASGTFSPNAEQTIAILASPPANVYAFQLMLKVEGATIVPGSFDPAFALNIGVCTDDPEVFSTSDSICVHASRTAVIENGTLLGQFKIKFDTGATTAIVKTTTGNGYLVGSSVSPDENRVLGTYTVSANNTPTATPLPITGIEDYPMLVIFTGILTVFVGIGFFVWRDRSQKLID